MPTIQLAGHRVGLLRAGRGEPVVLLHCSGATGAQWRPLVEALGDRFHLLAPDLYGHGGTAPWPGPEAYSLAHEAALVGALLDTLESPVHLVGHSYGGAVALHVARARLGRLRSLTLIEPVAFHLLQDGDAADALALAEFTSVGESMLEALRAGDASAAFGCFVDYWNGPGTWAHIARDKRAAMITGLSTVKAVFHALMADPARFADFAGVTAPTLLVQGTRTTQAARRVCERLAQAWPRARVERVAGAGHMSPVTHRAEVEALITGHLLAHAGAPARAEAALP
jgi:pimeloyl-ACP methyl ester carboxylesterase